MEEVTRESDWHEALVFIGAIVLALILFAIGHQTADNAEFFLLSAAALALSVPLMCRSYPPSESGRHFTWPRIGIATVISLAGIVVTVVIGHIYPDLRYVSPAVIGLAIVLPAYIRAP